MSKSLIRNVQLRTPGGGVALYEKHTATSGQTIFNLSDSYVVGDHSLEVYRNGKLLTVTTEYTETSSTRVTLANGAVAGDVIIFKVKGASYGGQIGFHKVTATANQTVINLPFTYTTGSNRLIVSVNGVEQVVTTDYTETSSTSITFTSGLTSGDVVVVRHMSGTAGIIANAKLSWSYDNAVTTDQSPSMSKAGQMFRYTSSTTADRTFNLPQITSSDDGNVFWVQNESSHVITLSPNSADSVWLSGTGYGIELAERALVCVRADYSRNKWDVIAKTGGLVRMEGLRLYLPCDFMGRYSVDANTIGTIEDLAKRHRFMANAGAGISDESKSKFGVGCLGFNGTNDYASNIDSPDWDIFASTTGMHIVAGWGYCTNLSVNNSIVYHYQDSNNFWGMRTSGNGLQLLFRVGGSYIINAVGGSSLATNTWFHWAIVIKNNIAATYINGSQVYYTTFSTTATFSGNLYFAQVASGDYLAGRLDDIALIAANPFNANPNSGKTDTLSNWNQVFQGVM